MKAFAALAAAALAFVASMGAATASPVAFEAAYSVRVKGVTAGEFVFNAALNGDRYEAKATRKTSGLVRSLAGNSQDYRYETRGALTAAGPRPVAYEHQGGKRDRLVQVAFQPNGPAITTATPVMGMGNPPATDAQKTNVIDQVSALVSILATPVGQDPCTRTLPVFLDGRARFDFVMRADGRQDIATPGWKGSALRCRVEFRPIAGFSDPQEAAALSFLLAPTERGLYVPVRIQMPTDDVGVVTLDLKRFSVSG